jgi:hypothetical protein
MRQEYFKEAEAGPLLIAVLAPEPRLVTEARQRRIICNSASCGTGGVEASRARS